MAGQSGGHVGLEMERRTCIEYELGYYQAENTGSVEVSCA